MAETWETEDGAAPRPGTEGISRHLEARRRSPRIGYSLGNVRLWIPPLPRCGRGGFFFHRADEFRCT